MQKITPFLWFDTNAEEAVKFYTSIFKNSNIGTSVKYGEAGAKASEMKKGSVMVIDFTLNGQDFTAINGGPAFTFNEAISLLINCKDQKEIDYYWEKLTEGGTEVQCGWLKDKYGLSWQVVPEKLGEWMKDPKKVEKVMAKVLTMKKLDLKILEEAAK